jgi:putative two-component system response regulator
MKRVLIADDDVTTRTVMETIVSKLGYEVISAEDGGQAVELWQSRQPSVVITDWNMPNVTGLELCRHIRKNEGDRYTYVLMVTSRRSNEDMLQGMEAGVDDYIVKPVAKYEIMIRLKASERIFSLQGRDTVIFVLAKLSEAKDTDTGYHLERIRNYCHALATSLHRLNASPAIVDPLFIQDIFLTSPLHDIGKVGIPDHILLKPDRLDDAEFAIMKRHTVIGNETLESAYRMNPRAAYLRMAADIARSHHEKWDGSGYPDGLKGEQIPMAARILAVADVYDALVSKRAYKDAFSHETARAIILDGRGSHFDPTVVDAFMLIEPVILEILNRHRPVDSATPTAADCIGRPVRAEARVAG